MDKALMDFFTKFSEKQEPGFFTKIPFIFKNLRFEGMLALLVDNYR